MIAISIKVVVIKMSNKNRFINRNDVKVFIKIITNRHVYLPVALVVIYLLDHPDGCFTQTVRSILRFFVLE